MKTNKASLMACLLAVMPVGLSEVLIAAPKAAEIQLTPAGKKLEDNYAGELKAMQKEFEKVLPKIDGQKITSHQKASEALKAAEAQAKAAQAAFGKIQGAKGLVEHAKGKWIGGAEKGIAQAEAALKKASSDAERDAAKKDLAKWQANKEDGLKELKIRQDALDKAKSDEPKLTKENEAAKAALAAAKAQEAAASKALLSTIEAYLATDKLDGKLIKCAILAEATPRGLAEFAQQGSEQAALVDKLLANQPLMKQMLEAGGAKFGKYGQAIGIYAAILEARPEANQGVLQRLALATSLEHAMPITQTNADDQTSAPNRIDPVKRYLHYEKAYLDGHLDPAFKNFSVWEYRMIVDCDAPDEILSWGREMLQTYRPDHIYNSDYGWRYSAAVKTEVPYGSQNVKDDLPSLQKYQNIIKNGGVCGRRAFFGRFILQSFGIPTWGVTQKAHAALSHWTPKGWVVNLGAGFEHSWWDKDEAPRSGSDFLLETQARAHGQDYMKVLRAKWISRILGEQPYNDRKGIAGGLWSNIAHNQSLALASTAVSLGPLGQELGEANESKDKQKIEQAKLTEEDKKITASQDGVVTIPAVAQSKQTGNFAAIKSYTDGFQAHGTSGFKVEYTFDAPRAGKYALTARVATAQSGQKFIISTNDAKTPVEHDVPYTIGLWKQTPPIEVSLVSGKNVLQLALKEGSRGVTIKDFTLTPAK